MTFDIAEPELGGSAPLDGRPPAGPTEPEPLGRPELETLGGSPPVREPEGKTPDTGEEPDGRRPEGILPL